MNQGDQKREGVKMSRPLARTKVDSTAVRNHLARIEQSDRFNDVKEQRELLRFVVDETLAGRGGKHQLTSRTIAKQVFGDEDGQIARTHFGRLRKTLLAYYRYETPSDKIRIELPEKGYTPAIVWLAPTTARPDPLQATSAYHESREFLRDALERSSYPDVVEIVARLRPFAEVDASYLEEIFDSLWLIIQTNPDLGSVELLNGLNLLNSVAQAAIIAGIEKPAMQYQFCLSLGRHIKILFEANYNETLLPLCDTALLYSHRLGPQADKFRCTILSFKCQALTKLRRWNDALKQADEFLGALAARV